MDQKTGDRLLLLLKTRGPQTTAELAAATAITSEGARQHLLRLQAEGLVEASTVAGGIGRPRQAWRLTRAGDARFPDGHADLASQLIRSIRDTLGEGALEQVIAAREAEAKQTYAAALAGCPDLGTRVARLAELREREGYMAEARQDGEGWLLIENHCPICAAATLCQGFCHAELRTFQDALGAGVLIERTDHIVAGARRCAYRITERTAE